MAVESYGVPTPPPGVEIKRQTTVELKLSREELDAAILEWLRSRCHEAGGQGETAVVEWYVTDNKVVSGVRIATSVPIRGR